MRDLKRGKKKNGYQPIRDTAQDVEEKQEGEVEGKEERKETRPDTRLPQSRAGAVTEIT